MLAFFQRFFINNPNGARVIGFLGHYMGTYFTEKIKVNNAKRQSSRDFSNDCLKSEQFCKSIL